MELCKCTSILWWAYGFSNQSVACHPGTRLTPFSLLPSQRQRSSFHRDYFRILLMSLANPLGTHRKLRSFHNLAFLPYTSQRKIVWCAGKRKCISLFLSSFLSKTLSPQDPRTFRLSLRSHSLGMSWLRMNADSNYGWILWPPLALCKFRSGRLQWMWWLFHSNLWQVHSALHLATNGRLLIWHLFLNSTVWSRLREQSWLQRHALLSRMLF